MPRTTFKRIIDINKNEIAFLAKTASTLKNYVFAKRNELAYRTCIDKTLNEDKRFRLTVW